MKKSVIVVLCIFTPLSLTLGGCAGNSDHIVPLSYSEKAARAYNSARLEVLPGAGYGFSGEDAKQAIDWILEYLNTHKA